MPENRFRSAFIAMVPDADPSQHRGVVCTSLYELTTVLVRDEDEAVRMCGELVRRDGVRSLLLCPGFTNRGVARIAEAVGEQISVNVARGDGPSNAAARRAMEEAGFFKR